MLEIKNITKSYGDTNVLDNISININTGKIIGITGRNGSGKTTLLKCLAGIIKTSSSKIPNTFAYLDDYSELFNMPAKEIISFYANVYKDFDVNKFLNLKSILHLKTDFSNPSEMSFGERKKFKLALVLSRNVDFYLLDEPFSEVDVFAIDEIIEAIISSIDLNNNTVLIVDHNVEVLEKMVDDIIFLSKKNAYYYSDIETIKNKNKKSLLDLYSELEELKI